MKIVLVEDDQHLLPRDPVEVRAERDDGVVCVEQGLLRRSYEIDELFAPETL